MNVKWHTDQYSKYILTVASELKVFANQHFDCSDFYSYFSFHNKNYLESEAGNVNYTWKK